MEKYEIQQEIERLETKEDAYNEIQKVDTQAKECGWTSELIAKKHLLVQWLNHGYDQRQLERAYAELEAKQRNRG